MTFFSKLIEEIRKAFSEFDYKIWLFDLKYLGISKKTLKLSTSSLFRKEKIEEKFLAPILKIAQKSNNEIKGIEIVHHKENSPTILKPFSLQTTEKSIKKIRKNKLILEENSFNNFLVYEENQLAYDFSQKVVNKIGYINPLYIYGQVGVGKTHLLHAIYNFLSQKFPFLTLKYINPNDFVTEYTTALKKKQDRDFRIKYKSLDVLLIDDIQFFIGKEKTSQEFFDIFNAIFTPNKQMVFCSDREPENLDQIDIRLKSRLSSSVILELKPPSCKNIKKLIIHFKQLFSTKFTSEIIEFLANNLDKDVRKIKAAIKSIFFFQEIYKQEIDVNFCQLNLSPFFYKNKKKIISPNKLLKIFCQTNNIDLDELKSNKKKKKISILKQMAIFLLRNHTNLSLNEIGQLMGGKTAPAVLYSFNYIEKKKSDSYISNILSTISASL